MNTTESDEIEHPEQSPDCKELVREKAREMGNEREHPVEYDEEPIRIKQSPESKELLRLAREKAREDERLRALNRSNELIKSMNTST